ncbi:protein-glutamate methylesterase CheB [Erwinia amylovora Ea644]|uniref:protein-glutamate methylesterase/protein-glutamine glutaminase n=1 Tax=Erwinia amylovora TaxID=552 RepID=UPI0002C922F4|nr:chemotaxis response regulator protein-glutamate methylesterase [Erwinia amylovora]CCP04013.1 protein-glutamate methylesterase CheB [Erwinia amylovora Ea644]CCP08077.1 protein-glutamate methylesterase CheB [Erwinia amylovora MR1]
MSKIRVLCVDDSALMRNMISAVVNQQHDMEMVATASDPINARELIKKFNPDVLTLDIDMPRMNGLEFLSRLMRLRPMPVVMISSLTAKGSASTLNALEIGAVDFIAKPDASQIAALGSWAVQAAEKIRLAAKSTLPYRTPLPADSISAMRFGVKTIIAIGASTGGTEALRQVLTRMPATSPGVVIAQHMPPGFTLSFAQRLNSLCAMRVKEAVDGEPVESGTVYIAPGDRHMQIAGLEKGYQICLNRNAAVNRHRPSVDVLFHSVAAGAGHYAIGAILTGMGADGAKGLLAMRQSGAWTLAQSERTCVVFGMPREAIALQAAAEVIDLQDISQRLIDRCSRQGRTKSPK